MTDLEIRLSDKGKDYKELGKPYTCPSCGKRAVEVRPLSGDAWLVKCYNGECEELPEVYSHTLTFALKLFKRWR